MAKLYFKYGAMGSSKTATALITKYNYEERGMRVWLMKPAADRRDGEFTLRSRIGLTAQCEAVGPDCDLRERYAAHGKADVIIVDECQFLTGEQIDQLRELVDRENLPVLCFGLRTDFQTKLFPGSRRLFELADSITEIKTICDDGVKYGCASVCIPASYVMQAAEYVDGKIAVCTVIGFPNGYDTTAAKCFQAADAVKNGASEIDMVINLGWVKDGLYDRVLEEIKAIKGHCDGRLLKVIIETCMLTDAEKIEMCRVVSESGADYIKTSTGFGGGGATREDVALFKAHVAPHVKIKAAGGIADLNDARDFVALGADRLGTSRIVKAVKAMEQ